MILYPDTVATAITKLQTVLGTRTEPYLDGLTVTSDAVPGRCVTITAAGGTVNNTFLTVNHAVDVYAPVAADAADIARTVAAVCLQHGPGGFCDGTPVTNTTLNSGPTLIQSTTEQTRYRMVIPTTVRGQTIE